MKGPRVEGHREDEWLRESLERAAEDIHAPSGFADRVMSKVYREALAPRTVAAAQAATTARAAGASRMYRRLGLSFVLTAAVLGASLLVPRAAYTGLLAPGGRPGVSGGSTEAVKSALDGAGSAVRGILGETRRTGLDAAPQGGETR